MIHAVLEAIGLWIMQQISAFGYLGVVFLMAIESACVPLPSEIIMPFAGTLTVDMIINGVLRPASMNIVLVGLAGALGCLVGSIVAYYVGCWGGRSFIERYGKFILISKHDLDTADRFFNKYGTSAIFISRLLPIVRTYISFPAGIGRMRFGRFCLYTFIGSVPWCLALAWTGGILGENWKVIEKYFRKSDIVIGILILVGILLYIYRHFCRKKI